jgi:hypothetical protein
MDSWISIAGSVASLGGAYWAYVEARNSAKHATEAEKIRNELVGRRGMVEVSKVHAETVNILRDISQVGPTCTTSTIRGVRTSDLAKKVEEYSRFLNEHSGHFDTLFENNAKALCTSLKPYIESLAEAQSFDDKKNSGKEIYYLINGFLPQVKELSDGKKEAPLN